MGIWLNMILALTDSHLDIWQVNINFIKKIINFTI